MPGACLRESGRARAPILVDSRVPTCSDPPAPPPPYVTRLLNLCNNANPNGTWSLFVEDDASMDSGNIAGGWSVTLETLSTGVPSADLGVTATATPGPNLINQTLVYSLAVTNRSEWR